LGDPQLLEANVQRAHLGPDVGAGPRWLSKAVQRAPDG